MPIGRFTMVIESDTSKFDSPASSRILPAISISLLVQICVLFLLVRLSLTIYGLFKKRWHLQNLTKNFGNGGLQTHFLLGDLHNFPPDGQGRMEKFFSFSSQVENIGRIWIGPFVAIILVISPDYVRAVLANADSKNNIVYDFLRPWLGDGLLTSGGQKWMRHRRLLTPAFHYEILKPYVKIFGDSTKVFLNKLAETNGHFIDVFQPVSLLTLDSLLKCSFSYESGCQTNAESPYIKAVYQIGEIIIQRSRFFPYHSDTVFHLSPMGRRFVKQCQIVHDKAESTIQKRKQDLASLVVAKEPIGRQGRKYLDFLDILIEAKDENGEGMTDLEMREEVDTFMFEGHDTTASGISWCLYNLARHPDYQQKCRKEIQQLMLHKNNEEIEWDDLCKLEFTTMFIKESLRVHPPVPGNGRTLIKDVKLPDGSLLPEGTFVSVSTLALHHHPLYWEKPEVFDPYRFSTENSRDRHSHAYIPFSAGPRNCIGKQFAMSELKVVIAMTVLRYHISPDPDRIPKMMSRLVLRSFDGIYLKFTPVEKLETP